ncbi:MAG: hypothetical protein ABIK31_03285 [candidate division WOR-3 bacterium]
MPKLKKPKMGDLDGPVQKQKIFRGKKKRGSNSSSDEFSFLSHELSVQNLIEVSTSEDYIPKCFGKVLPINKCIKCVWLPRCLYVNLQGAIEDLQKKDPELFAMSKKKLYDMSFLFENNIEKF